MYVDEFGNWSIKKAWKKVKKGFAKIGNGIRDTFGAFVEVSQSVINEVTDFGLFVYETGETIVHTIGDSEKPFSIFAKKASSWWKIWEYQIGFKVNVGKFNYSQSFGLIENSFSVGMNDASLNIRYGVKDFGIGFSKTINNVTLHSGIYFKTIPTAILLVTLCYAPQLAPIALALSGKT